MRLDNLPDITFAAADPAEMELNILSTVEGYLKRKLERADPLRLFLLGVEAIIIQQRLLIDKSAKMNLLAFAVGGYLDHIGALVGVERLPATAATTTLRLSLSAIRETATIIPAGTRATPDGAVYFALDADAVINAGELSTDAAATCTEVGETGNGFIAGEINRIVDPVPFFSAVVNITKSEGGADIEEDENFRERIQEAPEKFSSAGPEGAYQYYAKSASALISDVAVDSPEPGDVVVYPLLAGGVLPEEEMLSLVKETLSADDVRPLTDRVTVEAPTAVSYNVDCTYFISRTKATNAAAISAAAEAAVSEYIAWQKEKLGRDINPTELYYRMRAAGVKRVEIRTPVFRATAKNEVALADTVNVVFGGLEDD